MPGLKESQDDFDREYNLKHPGANPMKEM